MNLDILKKSILFELPISDLILELLSLRSTNFNIEYFTTYQVLNPDETGHSTYYDLNISTNYDGCYILPLCSYKKKIICIYINGCISSICNFDIGKFNKFQLKKEESKNNIFYGLNLNKEQFECTLNMEFSGYLWEKFIDQNNYIEKICL